MPRSQRSRRYKKFCNVRDSLSPSTTQKWKCSRRLLEDNVMRDYSHETSLNRTPEAPKKYSPRLLVMDLGSRTGSFISDDHNLNYSELGTLFSCNPIMEQNGKGPGTTKFHSPGLIATQTVDGASGEGLITETPRISHDSLLELDYQVEPLCTPVSGYETPLKWMSPNSTMPVFDLKDSAERVEFSGTELSFFTTQSYNGMLASTPIKKNNNVKLIERKLPNKIEIVKVNMETSTQLMQIDKGIQTSGQVMPIKHKSKYKALSVTVKIFAMCIWLGLTIKKSVVSLYQQYIEQKPTPVSHHSSNPEELHSNLLMEMALVRKELREVKDLVKSQLREVKDLVKSLLLMGPQGVLPLSLPPSVELKPPCARPSSTRRATENC